MRKSGLAVLAIKIKVLPVAQYRYGLLEIKVRG
jgi:hypothetical protein